MSISDIKTVHFSQNSSWERFTKNTTCFLSCLMYFRIKMFTLHFLQIVNNLALSKSNYDFMLTTITALMKFILSLRWAQIWVNVDHHHDEFVYKKKKISQRIFLKVRIEVIKVSNPGVADGSYFFVTKNIWTEKVPYFTVTKNFWKNLVPYFSVKINFEKISLLFCLQWILFHLFNENGYYVE
jgi:hypothetical protein